VRVGDYTKCVSDHVFTNHGAKHSEFRPLTRGHVLVIVLSFHLESVQLSVSCVLCRIVIRTVS